MAGLFPTQTQWRELGAAWRGQEDNALLRYSQLVRQRRRAALPWWRRQALLLLGLAAAAIALGCDGLSPHPLYGLSWSHAVVAAGVVGAVFAAGCWYLRTIFDQLVQAACLLSLAGKRKLEMQLDDQLLAARHTDAEILLGLGLPLLRAVLWPLLAAAVLARLLPLGLDAYNGSHPSVLHLAQAAAAAGQGGTPPLAIVSTIVPGWAQEMALAPIASAGIALSGLLAVCSLLLLALLAGDRLRMDVQAGVLAALYSVGSTLYGGIALVVTWPMQRLYGASHIRQLDSVGSLEPVRLIGWTAALLACVLLPLRLARWRGIGLVVLYGLPLLFCANLGLLLYGISVMGRHGRIDPSHWIFDCFTAWSMFAPVSAIAVPHPACLGTGFYHLLAHPAWHQFRWPLLILAQLVLVCGLLRTALDSIAARQTAEG